MINVPFGHTFLEIFNQKMKLLCQNWGSGNLKMYVQAF